MAKIKRNKKEARRRFWQPFREAHQTPCPNCGQPGSHYVGPSMGEEGFFVCFEGEREQMPKPAVVLQAKDEEHDSALRRIAHAIHPH